MYHSVSLPPDKIPNLTDFGIDSAPKLMESRRGGNNTVSTLPGCHSCRGHFINFVDAEKTARGNIGGDEEGCDEGAALPLAVG